MTNISGNQKTICRESIKCYYKVDGTCTFRKNIEAMLSVLQEKYHKGATCIINLADTYNLPCKDLDEKSRQHGIGNLFSNTGAVH